MANENEVKNVEKKTLKQKIAEAKAKREQKKQEVDPEKAEKRKKTLKRVGLGAAAVIGGVITGVCLFGKDDADEEIEADEDEIENVKENLEKEADEAPSEE